MPNRAYVDRARWYVDRIDALLQAMRDAPRPTGDDVEQCQAMLRELLAKFRADRRPVVPGSNQSSAEQAFAMTIAQAGDALRLSAATRPTGRWRDELNACRVHLDAYLARAAAPAAH